MRVRCRSYPSFVVRDLHTVDNGVIEHLMPSLRAAKARQRGGGTSRAQGSMVVAHFLGVDHVGHRFGPSHPQMALKLKQMDGVLRQLLEARPLCGAAGAPDTAPARGAPAPSGRRAELVGTRHVA